MREIFINKDQSVSIYQFFLKKLYSFYLCGLIKILPNLLFHLLRKYMYVLLSN